MKITEMFMRILRHVNNHPGAHTTHMRYNHTLILIAEIGISFHVCCFQIQIMHYYAVSLIFSFWYFWLNRKRVTDLQASLRMLNVKVIQRIYIPFWGFASVSSA